MKAGSRIVGKRVGRYALAPLTVVLMVAGLALFGFLWQILTNRYIRLPYDMELPFVFLFALLGLAGAGILWAPLGAAHFVRHFRREQPREIHPAVVGATYASTFLAPWVYVAIRRRGKHVWRPATWLAYLSLYVCWLYGPVVLLGLGFLLIISLGGQPVTSFVSVMVGAVFLLMAFAWCSTLYLLLVAALRLKSNADAPAFREAVGWPIPGVYYAPFALSFASLVPFVLFGLYVAFGT